MLQLFGLCTICELLGMAKNVTLMKQACGAKLQFRELENSVWELVYIQSP